MVPLDEKLGVYRVALPAGSALTHLDVSEIQGEGIEEDLLRRDFTINALALEVGPDQGGSFRDNELLDPRGGLKDLERKVLRTESAAPLRDDPVRVLRAFRIAAEAGLTIEERTLGFASAARQGLRREAGERIQNELMALLSVPRTAPWLDLMDRAEVLTVVFEDLEASRKCALEYHGPGGVLRHSLDAVSRADFLLERLGEAFPDSAPGLRDYLASRSRPGRPHAALLRLAVLLHDVAKPMTAKRVGGRLRFFGHDSIGAKAAGDILRKLRFPGDEADAVSLVVLHHLRPGHLAAGAGVTERAAYRFFRDVGPRTPTVLLSCWADHASYLSPEDLERLLPRCSEDPQTSNLSRLKPENARKTVHHLRIIADLLRRGLAQPEAAAAPMLDGHAVMKALDLPPGPKVGKILARLREAEALGKVKTRSPALDFISSLKLK